MFLEPTSGPGPGVRIREQKALLIARAAFTAGDLGMLDLGNTDGDVSDNNLDGGEDSGWANVINPATTEKDAGFFVVTDEDVADNAEHDWIVTSPSVQAFVHTTGGGSAAEYDGLYPDQTELNAMTYDAPATGEGAKMIGLALAAVTTPTTPTLGAVAFSGIVPFGALHSD